jgi:hypothetical protein
MLSARQANVIQSHHLIMIFILHNQHARSQLRASIADASAIAKNNEQIYRKCSQQKCSALHLFPLQASKEQRTSYQAPLHAICSSISAPAHTAFSRAAGNRQWHKFSVKAKQVWISYPDNAVDRDRRRRGLTKEQWIHLPAEDKCYVNA